MEILHVMKDDELQVQLVGRLDSVTSTELETFLKTNLTSQNKLTFDFEKLEYISSAGLRVLLAAQKVMNNQGSMSIHNVNEAIMEVFDITGFTNILTIE